MPGEVERFGQDLDPSCQTIGKRNVFADERRASKLPTHASDPPEREREVVEEREHEDGLDRGANVESLGVKDEMISPQSEQGRDGHAADHGGSLIPLKREEPPE